MRWYRAEPGPHPEPWTEQTQEAQGMGEEETPAQAAVSQKWGGATTIPVTGYRGSRDIQDMSLPGRLCHSSLTNQTTGETRVARAPQRNITSQHYLQ